MTTRQEYITAVEKLVPGEHPIGEAEIILAIGMAMKGHSRHSPREVIEDVAGDGSFDYAVSGFASWSDGFSVIRQVEYPVDDTDEDPDILQDDKWMIYEKPAGKCLRFLTTTPDTGEEMRLTYTALHTCTDSACTVNDFDEEVVQALAAAFFCDMLATYYAQTGDSTIDADVVDHKSRSRDYEARAKAYRKLYFDHLGIEPGETPAASVTRDQDRTPSWQTDHLTHRRKYR
ncbi:MAG: hypothetical protein SV375_00085 [Thermodesulfobacteriota bacterium]|nr:hypothetical protein [Thermodesulfobacteriota bacterium]